MRGVNAKTASCITPSPSLSPKGERSMTFVFAGSAPHCGVSFSITTMSGPGGPRFGKKLSARQPRRFDAGDADCFVLFARAAAGARRAQHIALRVLDHDGAGLRQELALTDGGERAVELRPVVACALQQGCGLDARP